MRIFNDIERNLTDYLSVVTLINACVGVAAGIITYLVGFPNPIAFAVLAFVLNYIPYLGALMMQVVLFGVGMLTFPTLGQALLAPLLYLAFTTLEGHFITPVIMGHRLTLAPITVFIALVFWTWLWGPVGAFLAVPILICCLVAANHLFPADDNPLPGLKGRRPPPLVHRRHPRYTSSAPIPMLESYAQAIIDFVRQNQAWAAPIVFVLAFGESLAFISLLLPAWAALVGIGALIGSSGISFWHVWIAASIGAALGDWLSYWIGVKVGPAIGHVWPLSRHPQLLPKGEDFMKRWGVLGIFIGRFFGPLRAAVPLVAGIFHMPYWPFQLANFSSAFVWAAVLLLIGDVVSKLVIWLWSYFS